MAGGKVGDKKPASTAGKAPASKSELSRTTATISVVFTFIQLPRLRSLRQLRSRPRLLTVTRRRGKRSGRRPTLPTSTRVCVAPLQMITPALTRHTQFSSRFTPILAFPTRLWLSLTPSLTTFSSVSPLRPQVSALSLVCRLQLPLNGLRRSRARLVQQEEHYFFARDPDICAPDSAR